MMCTRRDPCNFLSDQLLWGAGQRPAPASIRFCQGYEPVPVCSQSYESPLTPSRLLTLRIMLTLDIACWLSACVVASIVLEPPCITVTLDCWYETPCWHKTPCWLWTRCWHKTHCCDFKHTVHFKRTVDIKHTVDISHTVATWNTQLTYPVLYCWL